MSNKSTSGPLRYHAKLSGRENHRGFVVFGPDECLIAEVMPIDPDGIQGEKLARLMCAAPDLLDALKRIMEYGDVYSYKSNETSPYAQAQAAIAKAEGEA